MALKTLLIPFENGALEWPENGKTAFINAMAHPALRGRTIQILQHFKPAADTFTAQRIVVSPTPENLNSEQDLILISLPKSRIESEYFIALALSQLSQTGTIVAAAENKAGGNRIEKTFQSFGLENLNTISKNKARVVWAHKGKLNAQKIKDALNAGKMQLLGDTWTQAGIFGWDKIDRGSFILSDCLPELEGHGADFGCGYGFLSLQILNANPKIKSLICAEADYRALECCKKNTEEFAAKTKFEWLDLTKETPFKNLDFIVMNPPFHEGKKTAPSIGISFIENAAKSLKRGGTVYMVANSHLPYEKPLEANFQHVEKIFEGDGFKVYKAIK